MAHHVYVRLPGRGMFQRFSSVLSDSNRPLDSFRVLKLYSSEHLELAKFAMLAHVILCADYAEIVVVQRSASRGKLSGNDATATNDRVWFC